MKEPALSDGRLQPGDKLLAANGVELASFSHQEVIMMAHSEDDDDEKQALGHREGDVG